MIIKTKGKLNLYLDVIGTYEDGYHKIETITREINLFDRLECDITKGDKKIIITCDNTGVPVDSRNIVYKSAEAFIRKTGISFYLKVNIEKNIPVQAGMGGGSANAAGILSFLNSFFNTPLTEGELYSLALIIGADVPMCLKGGTNVCRGKGEILEPLPELVNCVFLIIKPDFGVSTGKAYALYDQNPLPPKGNLIGLKKAIEEGTFLDNTDLMYNAFEHLCQDDRINKIKSELINSGAINALMTGSGSAVFGVFPDFISAETAFEKLSYTKKYIAYGE